MRRILFAPLLILTACVAVVDLPIPQNEPVVQLKELRCHWREPVVYGPFTVTYELTVFNPSDRTLFVRAVDLHSSRTGAYQVTAQTRRLNLAVPPYESASALLRVSAWATGGEASAYEPMTLHGQLHYGHGHSLAFEATP